MKKDFSIDEIEKIAQEIYNHIGGGNGEMAQVVALDGELGAGKTTLTQKIAKLFGVQADVISPTFTIMKKYETNNKNFKNLIHIDAYRLDKEDELTNLGWSEMLRDKDNLIIIEWHERVANLIPQNSIVIKLEHIDEGKRSITF
jgi:tRNA threonylcarbamoyladenosine biosynthesis protein TsaE